MNNKFTFKDIVGHPYESHYDAPKGYKPYVKYIKEDFKIADRKAREEVQKAYTKGYTPDYILDNNVKQPKFELKDGILCFVE